MLVAVSLGVGLLLVRCGVCLAVLERCNRRLVRRLCRTRVLGLLPKGRCCYRRPFRCVARTRVDTRGPGSWFRQTRRDLWYPEYGGEQCDILPALRAGLPTPALQRAWLGVCRFAVHRRGRDWNPRPRPSRLRVDRWRCHAAGTPILAPFGPIVSVPVGPERGVSELGVT